MSEPIPAKIEIGGRITRSQFDEMLRLEGFELGDPGTGPMYEGASLESSPTPRLVIGYHSANYGEFPDLEAYLVSNGIPFDRHSDARYEIDAEEVCFRSGMEKPLVSTGTQDDASPVVNQADVAKAIEQAASAEDAVESIRGLLKLHYLRAEIAPLPPLEIEDDELSPSGRGPS